MKIKSSVIKYFAVCLFIVSALSAFVGCGHEHTYSTKWSTDSLRHWHESNCGHDVVADEGFHDYDAYGICAVCGHEKPHTEHSLEFVEYQAPGCVTRGCEEHYRCTVCGRYFSDGGGVHSLDYDDVVIKATGHSFEVTLSHDDEHHYYAATCGHDVEKDGEKHVFVNGECRVCLYRPGYTDVYKDDVRYTLSADGQSYYVSGEKINELKGVIIESEIDGKPVTEIGEGAFYNCPGLTGVIVPDSVTTIKKNAFDGCARLSSFTFGSSVKTVESCAFLSCLSMSRVFYTGDVKAWCEIEFADAGSNPVFYLGMPGLFGQSYGYLYIGGERVVDLEIPDGVTEISKYAFGNYRNLSSVTLSDSVEHIGKQAFFGSGLSAVTFGNGKLTVDDGAFDCPYDEVWAVYAPSLEAWCNITFGKDRANPLENAFDEYAVDPYPSAYVKVSEKPVLYIGGVKPSGEVTLPSGIKEIPAFTFKNCDVTRVTIPSGIQKIGNGAFFSCTKLEGVEIADTVRTIGDYAFYQCVKLTAIPDGRGVTEVGDYAFYKCIGSNAVLDELAVREGIKTIGRFAYSANSARKLIVPASVEQIKEHAFYGMNWVNAIEVDPANKNYKSDGDCLIEKATGTVILGCSASVIPNDGSIKAIGDHAFAFCDLADGFVIPQGVTSIGKYAFRYNSHLTTLVIPDSVTELGEDAFDDCRELTELTLPDSIVFMPNVGNFYMYYDAELKAERYVDGALYIGKHLIDARGVGESYTVKDGTITVGANVFSPTLKSAVVPDSVVYIAPYVFDNKKGLTSVRLGKGVTELGNLIFSSCKALEAVYITSSVVKIGPQAFSYCESLSTLYYDGTIEQWNAVEKAENWRVFQRRALTVQCSDGTVEYTDE